MSENKCNEIFIPFSHSTEILPTKQKQCWNGLEIGEAKHEMLTVFGSVCLRTFDVRYSKICQTKVNGY